jgi:two-component system NtrC family sensor kinase
LTEFARVSFLEGAKLNERAFVLLGILKLFLNILKNGIQAMEFGEQKHSMFSDCDQFLNHLPGAVCRIQRHPTGLVQYLFVSEGCQSLFEVSPFSIQQDANLIQQLIHPDDRLCFEQAFQNSAQTLEVCHWKGRCILSSGQLKWIEANFHPELLSDGMVIWDGIFLDITHHKRTEQFLQQTRDTLETQIQNLTIRLQNTTNRLHRELEERKEALHELEQVEEERDRFFNRSADMFCIAGFDGYFKRVNPAFEQVLGYASGELYTQPFLEFVHPEDRAETLNQAAKLSSGGEVGAFENRYRCKDGSYRWLSWSSTPYPKEQLIYASIRDVTAQKQIEADRLQAELSLQKEREFLKAMLDNLADGIVACDEFGKLTLFNKATREFHGLPEIPLPPDQWATHFDLYRADGKTLMPMEEIPLFRAFAGELVQDAEMVIAPKQGKTRILLASGQAFFDGDGKKLGAVVVMHDITDRRNAEIALQNALQASEYQSRQLEQTLRELRHTQAKLVQTEKMSSLGQLVAGVAHEINNPVNFIYGNLTHADEYTRDLINLLQLYQHHYPNPTPDIQIKAEAIDLEFLIEDLPKLMNSMRLGANRIQKIVSSLRIFSRMDEATMKAVDIHEGIDSTLMILQNRLKARSNQTGIEIVKNYGALPLVECYPGQLNQVFMNILSNAIDALEEVFEKNTNFFPCIQIQTEYTEQKQVKIRIIDNGSGIHETVQQHIFDPFFTTKPVGKGTGLGMSISYQIITERHGGSLTCESELGKGTEFTIEIPIRQ